MRPMTLAEIARDSIEQYGRWHAWVFSVDRLRRDAANESAFEPR